MTEAQGTVAAYDRETGDGAVLRDDGARVQFDRSALERAGLRLLREGQRVRMRLDASGRRALVLTAITLPLPPEG
ncbi:cold-shock protein [Motilibacter deserti]|uniref:Cold shock domain-containing protein n=1 Tax=Motilibacter deserti TaxID=2714956 RepID=A0ABX0GV44_9ACTN|nr:cold shock domain-containing protein [Motilibacter deserti]